MFPMNTPRLSWGGAGVLAGLAGLAVSHGATAALNRPRTPVGVVRDLVPSTAQSTGSPSDAAAGLVSPIAQLLMLAVFAALMLSAGRLSARAWWASLPIHIGVGGVLAALVLTRQGGELADAVPVVAATVVWIWSLSLLTEPTRAELRRVARDEATPDPEKLPHALATRRAVLVRAGLVTAGGAVAAVGGKWFSEGRREVERLRRLLNLPVTDPRPPAAISVGVDGITPWQTGARRFFRQDTVFQVPAIRPGDWQLRIHGMVDEERVISFADLIGMKITEDWVTLSCVTNPVGGELVGNAWWSGVRVARLLEMAGVQPGADAVLQTSYDGWQCGTPLAALTDDRNALVAVAMNGEPLTLEHGFPARTIVPGLFGYVSACKWVVDLEVTRFDDIETEMVAEGFAELSPIELTSRVDVPREGDEVKAGVLLVGGVAWSPHVGIGAVEIAVDGGPWQFAHVGGTAHHRDGNPNRDTWVQWSAEITVPPGDHEIRVRAITVEGTVQTGVERDPNPGGASGWHTRKFSAS